VATRKLVRQSVASLCDELAISERQLRRRVRAAAGYGPRALARVMRFSRFVAAIDSGRTDLALLAHELGYADQSHLTRESRRLSGLPPRALIEARGMLPDGTPSGGFLPD
jgi:methylphosphotriester-DNA--protein-cysteine methyltransferase